MDGVKNKHRERFRIIFPADLNGLPDLTQSTNPPSYESEEQLHEPVGKRMMFDHIGITQIVDCLIVAGDLSQKHSRSGLSELINVIFSYTLTKSVVQFYGREDKPMDHGLELCLRTLEFGGIAHIDEKLSELSSKGIVAPSIILMLGVVLAKYGSWETNPDAKEAIWVFYGVWPKSVKCAYIP
jgi:hypothetical protein